MYLGEPIYRQGALQLKLRTVTPRDVWVFAAGYCLGVVMMTFAICLFVSCLS